MSCAIDQTQGHPWMAFLLTLLACGGPSPGEVGAGTTGGTADDQGQESRPERTSTTSTGTPSSGGANTDDGEASASGDASTGGAVDGSTGTSGEGPGSEDSGGSDTSGTDTGGTDTGGLPEPSSDRGYQPRGCGFDLDDDGVLGEPEDCVLCRGASGAGPVSVDVDGDGDDETEIYVDCTAGTNASSCGGPSDPCRSIPYAFDTVVASTPSAGEHIVCFTGVCGTANQSAVDTFNLRHSGSGVTTRASSGSQVRDFEYPRDPVMLVGWDRDGDGVYPPVDVDDVADLDGHDVHQAFTTIAGHIELAHFRSLEQGADFDQDSTDDHLMRPGGMRSHIYVHDLSVRGLNRGNGQNNQDIGIRLFGQPGLEWFAIENSEFLDTGGYFLRGGDGGEIESGPYRFQNLTVTFEGCPSCEGFRAAVAVSKLWGAVTGQEWLDNVFDAQPRAWGSAGLPQNIGGGAVQCVQDLVYRNNEVIDFTTGFSIQSWDPSGCAGPSQRSVDRIVVDENAFRFTFPVENPYVGTVGILVGGQPAPEHNDSYENVTIRNNRIVATSGTTSGGIVFRATGNQERAQTGTLEVSGNDLELADLVRGFQAAILFESGTAFPAQDVRVRDNTTRVSGMGARNLSFDYAPVSLDSGNNCFSPDATFEWSGMSVATLPDWVAASGQDADSTATCGL